MSETSPFASPDESQAAATDAIGTIAGIEIAFQNRRFCNVLIDNILVRIVATASEAAVSASVVADNIGRTLCRLVPFKALSFLFGDKTTGWHDLWSGTLVVRKSK